MSSADADKVVYPVVVIKVGGIECRALLDTGSSSSYASTQSLDKLGQQPTDIRESKSLQSQVLQEGNFSRQPSHQSLAIMKCK